MKIHLLTLIMASATAADVTPIDNVFDLPYYQQLAKERIRQASVSSRDRKRLPVQPLHRTILEHLRCSVLRANNVDAVHPGANLRRELDAIKVHASNVTDGAYSSNESEAEEDNSNQQQQLVSPLLTSPWWNRIHEDYGTHSYNFIPESRRAASAVVYLMQKYRRLEDATDDGNDEAATESVEGEAMLNTSIVSNLTVSEPDEHKAADDDSNEESTDVVENDIPHVNTTLNTSSIESEVGAQKKSQTQPAANSSAENTIVDTNDSVENTPSTKQRDQPQANQQKVTNAAGEEFMIISGGYTDHDWKTFPVYAFPLSSSITSGSGKWIDLSPLSSELQSENSSESWCKSRDNIMARDRLYQEAKYLNVNSTHNETNPWDHADPCAPSGRMGHSSFIHEKYLYVFGGLIYDSEQAPTGSRIKEAFRLEDVPYVYRLDLEEMLDVREVDRRKLKRNGGRRLDDVGLIAEIESLFVEDDDETLVDIIDNMEEVLEASHDMPPSKKKVKGWQRIIPRVKPFESLNGMPAMAASEVLLKSINRGEMQGGMWNGKYVMYGGLRIVLSDVAGSAKIIEGSGHSTGGSTQQRSRVIELPLGDVWAYDVETDAFEKITNSFGKPEGVDDSEQEIQEEEFEKQEAVNDDDNWWSRLDASSFPRPRTAHAATVVGDELVVHGGMGWDEHVDDWDGSTDWETLDDMWILNLKTLQWKRRCVYDAPYSTEALSPLTYSCDSYCCFQMDVSITG